MNRSSLIEDLSHEMQITIQEAAGIVSTILDTMTASLILGETIEIRGFGSFTIKHYESYEGRNPLTGEKVLVKPKRLPFFKPGKDLRELVNASQAKSTKQALNVSNKN